MSASSAQQQDYWLRRDYLASARLNLQSYLWRDSLGYVIHPKIPHISNGARVADIGTGTGIWAVQLAHEQASTSIQVDGFDIDISQCPPAEWMPPNVRFRAWNAFEDLPEELIGHYDIVHIRLFMINIKNNDSSRIIRNLHKMLKPGGWLQWEEVNNTDNHIVKVSDTLSTPAMDGLLYYIHEGSKKHRGADDWLLNLPATLEQSGFDNIEMKVHEDPPALRRYFYETWLLTLEEFSSARLVGTEQQAENLRLIRESHAEMKKGAAIQLGKLVCIARKLA